MFVIVSKNAKISMQIQYGQFFFYITNLFSIFQQLGSRFAHIPQQKNRLYAGFFTYMA